MNCLIDNINIKEKSIKFVLSLVKKKKCIIMSEYRFTFLSERSFINQLLPYYLKLKEYQIINLEF